MPFGWGCAFSPSSGSLACRSFVNLPLWRRLMLASVMSYSIGRRRVAIAATVSSRYFQAAIFDHTQQLRCIEGQSFPVALFDADVFAP